RERTQPDVLAGVRLADISVERLARGEHLHELLGAADARLRLLRLLDAEDERVPVATVEGREELAGAAVPVEEALELLGHGGGPLPGVGGVPTAVRLGPFHLPEPGRAHAARRDQLRHLVAVDPRPGAPG